MDPRLDWSDDTKQADWIVHVLRNDYTVGMLLPSCFEAYARLLHPIVTDMQSDQQLPVRWKEIASDVRGTIHPSVQFAKLAPRIQSGPPLGSLPFTDARPLVEILAQFSSDARCWFCLWSGYGFLSEAVRRKKMVTAPLDREYLLYSGTIDSALAITGWPWCQTPNLWWPASHDWCVATEIDLDSTYVGGTEELIHALLQDQRLEALSVSPHDLITLDSDTLNSESRT